MFLPTPSLRQDQNTFHVLVRCFREIYSDETITKEKVQNLVTSKYRDSSSHDVYVERLEAIQLNCTSKIKEINDLLNHIKETLFNARSLERNEFEEQQNKYKTYSKLGLPPVASKLNASLNTIALQKHHLIVLNDSFVGTTNLSADVSKDGLNKVMLSKDVGKKDEERRTEKDEHSLYSLNEYKKNAESSDLDKDLLKLQKTFNFLKNPRFTDIKRVATASSLSDEKVDFNNLFKPTPCPLVFRNCLAGEIYELKLDLMNISSSSRQIRVLPPTTKYFSLSVGDFPSANGVVAPGMSCQFTVKFMPDTLADYSDVLEVKTQGSQPIFIPLEGLRDKPFLSISKHIDCGYTLVNGKKLISLEVENKGGAGKFFFKENQIQNEYCIWDQIDYTDVTKLLIKPFTVFPAQFQVNNGGKISLTIIFEPRAVKHFSEDIYLFCDDCSVTKYTLTGTSEVAHVSINNIEGGFTYAHVQEMIDETAEQIINFGRSYPNELTTRMFAVKNDISVPLNFYWTIQYPDLRVDKSGTSNLSSSCKNQSVFKVLPEFGVLKENILTKFSVQFNPLKVGQFYDIAALYLENIPNAYGENTVENPIKLSIKGFAESVTVLPEPPIIIFSGKLFIGVNYKQTIKLKNLSQCKTSFQWKKFVSKECIIDVLPEKQDIGNNESVECFVSIEGIIPSNIKCDIKYDVPFSMADQYLRVEGTFHGPSVSFVEDFLDFELLRIGTYTNKCVTLINYSPIPAEWKLNKLDEDLPLAFFPEEGVIKPNGKQKIAVHFSPQIASFIESYICCNVNNGLPCYIPIQAHVQRPYIYTKQCLMVLDTLFVGVPTQAVVTIVNSTFLTSSYEWNFIKTHGVDVVFEPRVGELASYEEAYVAVTIICLQTGEQEIMLFCNVADMLDPVVVNISVSVKGLQVDVLVPHIKDLQSGPEDVHYLSKLDFGMNVPLGEVRKSYLILENKSAIKTTFSIQAENYYPTEIFESQQSQINALLKTHEIDANKIEINQDICNEALANKKGVVFIISPNVGILEAFEKKLITVLMMSDMWGDYNDIIAIDVPSIAKQYVPVHVDVVGYPLDFRMARGQTTAVLRFGSHMSGDKEVLRKIFVNNKSYVDIRLDWKTYRIDPTDNKYIDLNVFIGNPFPLLNEELAVKDNIKETELKSNEHLIRVIIGEHVGVQSDLPFNIKTKQMTVLGKSNAYFEIGFQPPVGVNKVGNFVGYALGYMSINDKDRENGEWMKRMDGLDMLPFSINMTGAVKPSQILVTPCDDDYDDDGFMFRLSCNNLLTMESIQCVRRFILLNNSDVVVNISCQIDHPFKIVQFGEHKQIKRNITLSPNKNTQLHISFEISCEFAVSLHKVKDANSHEAFVEKYLFIKFSNQQSQMCCMTGQLLYPFVTVQKKVFNFKTCFVGEVIEDILTIQNSSNTNLHWELYKDVSCPESINTVFYISQTFGTIACEASSVARNEAKDANKNEAQVKIKFAPAHMVEYECDVFIRTTLDVLFNEQPQKLTLQGKGSFDEAYSTKKFFP
ncbi:deleted in lung and esophageal cancer protein 1 isoform X4 [Hydra vulgaris]|uniref:Deleted in lung and esophageal cancer protein 1 isoform X4 n=1 Tax=Hydra vulgaris TaxID=6087 RepID=A0ABM4CTQ1_HYDVU